MAFSFGSSAKPTFSFGASQTQQPASTQPATTSPFSFGSTSSPAFAFNSNAATTATPALFSSNANPSQATASNSLFKSAPAATNFTFNAQPQQSVLGGSLFASPAALSATSQQPTLSQSILGGPQAEIPIVDRLRSIQQAWDPTSPSCQFMYYVYNVMDPQRAQYVQQHGQQRTQQDINESLWFKALRENPDSSRLIPHLIIGLDALQKRAAQQQEYAQKHQAKLEEFAAKLKQLSSQYSLQTSLRIQKAVHAQAILSARLTSIVTRIHALTPQRTAPIRPEEDALKVKVDSLASEFTGKRPAEATYFLQDPAYGVSGGRLQTKVNELWVIMAQKKSKQLLTATSKEEWAVTNEQELGKVLEVLAQQQRTLDYLSQTLQKDTDVLNVIKKGFNEPGVAETERRRQQHPISPMR